MLYFVTTRRLRGLLDVFLSGYGRSLLGRVVPLAYEDLLARKTLRPASYLFGDLERLDHEQLGRAASIYHALGASGRCPHLLNDPARAMRRYELLRTLHEEGLNDFDVYRITERRAARRYPVFVRGENDHEGARSALLETPEQLEAAVVELLERGHPRDDLLVTEFHSEPGPSGIYEKYAAFCVRGQVIPSQILWSQDWCVKEDKVVNEDTLARELAYHRENPHADEIRRIFALAHLDYGRVDYGLVDGRMQVYEINTHPNLGSYVDVDHLNGKPVEDRRTVVKDILYPRLVRQLEALTEPAPADDPIPAPKVRRRRALLRTDAVWGALLKPLGLSSRLPLVLARKTMRSSRRRALHE